MSKKTSEAPEATAFRAALARFTKQADRGTALIAAAWVDDALEGRLRVAFRPDTKVVDELVRPDGPLGSFGARIKLAFLLDVIEATQRKDLDIIRRIRNDFAHHRTDLRFTTRSIRDRCADFHAVYACRQGGWRIRSPKQRFLVTAFFLAEALISDTAPKRRDPLLDHADSYGSWIRRTVKSSSLEQMARELEAMTS